MFESTLSLCHLNIYNSSKLISGNANVFKPTWETQTTHTHTHKSVLDLANAAYAHSPLPDKHMLTGKWQQQQQ